MNSVGVQWNEVYQYVIRCLAKKFSTSVGEGGGRVDDTCFFRSVQKCLSSNLDLYYSVIEITEKIRGEVTKNGDMF